MAKRDPYGINVTINTDSTKLSEALKDVTKNGRELQKELRQVERLLKLDPANTTLLAQKQEVLAKSTENVAEKLTRMKAVEADIEKQFKSGKIGEEQYRAFKRELEATEAQLKRQVEQTASLTTQMYTLDSELRLVNAQYGDGRNEVKRLTAEQKILVEQFEVQGKRAAEARQEYETLSKELGENAQQTHRAKQRMNEAETAMYELEGRIKKTADEIKKQGGDWSTYAKNLQSAGDKIQDVGGKINSVGNKLTIGVTAPIAGMGVAAIKSATDYESAFTGVRKTTDMTEEELQKVSRAFRDMALEIPATAEEIAGVGEAAGQLGIQNEHIVSFTRSMIDLGEATADLSSEEAATQLAQFANITQMSQKDFDRLGSTIVELGNNSATTEGKIVEMGQRLAGAGKQVGMSEADIMGIATALSSVGIEAQAGGSAFSKVMVNMQLAAEKGGDELADFAKVAGMSATDFAKKYKEDAAGALTAFVGGLGRMEDSGQSAIKVLDDMGITEVRMRDALLRASGAGDLLADSIKLGNDAWAENTALTKEAATRYETTESKMKMSQNAIKEAGMSIGEHMLPFVADLAGKLADVAGAFADLDPKTQKAILRFGLVAAAVGPTTKAIGGLTTGIGKIASGGGKTLEFFGRFTKSAKDAKNASDAVSKVAGSVDGAFKTMGNSADSASGSVSSMAGSIGSLGPVIGIAVAALGALAIAVGHKLTEEFREAEKAQKEYDDTLISSLSGIKEFGDGIDSARSRLGDYNTEIIISAEKQQEFDDKIQKAQDNILTIARTAAKEMRKLTKEESAEIEKLIGLINDYTDKKIEAYEEQQKVVSAMATQEKEMNEKNAQELINTAREAKEETLAIARVNYQDQIALAEESYGHLGEKNKEAYDKIVDDAKKAFDEHEENANTHYAETLKIVTDGFYDQQIANNDHLKILAKSDENRLEQMQMSEEEKMDLLKMSETDRQNYINKKNNERKDELKKALEGENADLVEAYIRMAMDTELYGGKVSNEGEKFVENYIKAFDDLSPEMQQVARDAISPLYDEMDKQEPSLLQKASNIAGGIINKLKGAFDIHSPSRVMQKIAGYIWEPLEDRTDKASKTLDKQTLTASQIMLKNMTGIQLPNIGALAGGAVASTTSTSNYNNYGAEQVVVKIPIDGREIASVITPKVSQMLASQNKNRGRALGL